MTLEPDLRDQWKRRIAASTASVFSRLGTLEGERRVERVVVQCSSSEFVEEEEEEGGGLETEA